METNELIYNLPNGIWNWYPFRDNSRVLFIGAPDDSLVELFIDMGLELKCISYNDLLAARNLKRHSFDYITGIRLLECCSQREDLLKTCKFLLKEHGVLLLGEENRYGLRYFCGEREPYTERNFDGIENYRTEGLKLAEQVQDRKRLFARFELKKMLYQAGFGACKFYSILSALEFPQMIYAEDYLPEEEMAIRYTPYYNNTDTLFLEEEYLYDDLIRNGMFHQMANAYLIECSLDGVFSDIKHVTISMDRGRERALTTIITGYGKVIKKAIYEEGRQGVVNLADHMQDLKEHGINVVQGSLQGNCYVMPYVRAENGVHYFQRLLFEDKEKFIEQIDRFWKCVLQSSEEASAGDIDLKSMGIPGVSSVKDINLGKYYKRVYIDMVPLNCFVENDEFLFFDQEFCLENYPVNMILYRTLNIIYQGDSRMQEILPITYFMEKYGLEEKQIVYSVLNARFMAALRKKNQLMEYHERHQAKGEIIYRNRQRINYSQEEYQKLFVDILENTENKKLLLFGSGSFAVRFMEWFGDSIKVDAVLDNSPSRWGQYLNGVEICSPKYLNGLEPESYKVIICVKNYLVIMRQLKQMGAKYISVYDAYIDYRRGLPTPSASNENLQEKNMPEAQRAVACIEMGAKTEKKRYHIGYVAGVFDLFHIGHLNLFKRAKEYCDYLIVGVVTDEGVRKNKNRDPYVPFEERIELVRSCKYVDEAVKIPLYSAGTRDAFRRYHFDCQFSGSDYIDDPYWLGEQAYLRSHGSDLIFFPYTEQTSSTKLREAISKR